MGRNAGRCNGPTRRISYPSEDRRRSGITLWSRWWMAWMCRTVRLRARMRMECVSARWPKILIPRTSALSVMPVERHDHQVPDVLAQRPGREAEQVGQGHVEQTGGAVAAQRLDHLRAIGNLVAVVTRQIAHDVRCPLGNLRRGDHGDTVGQAL